MVAQAWGCFVRRHLRGECFFAIAKVFSYFCKVT